MIARADHSIDIYKLKPVPSHEAILAAMSNPILYRSGELARRFKCSNASMHKALKDMAAMGLVVRGVKDQHSAYAPTGVKLEIIPGADTIPFQDIVAKMEVKTYYRPGEIAAMFGHRACNFAGVILRMERMGLIHKIVDRRGSMYSVNVQSVPNSPEVKLQPTLPPYRPEWQPYLTPIKGYDKALSDFRANCEATR